MYLIEYDLVLHIIEYYFGHTASKLASHLLVRGPISLHKLVNYSEYKFKVVRNTLVILIQHGIVEYTLDTLPYGNRFITHVLYSIKSENVLSLMLIPYILILAKDNLDQDTYKILLHISKYGILSLKKIKETLNELESQTIFESISKLVNNGYIISIDTYAQHKSKHLEFTYRYEGNFDVLDNLANDKYSTSSGVAYGLSDDSLYKLDFNFIVEHLVKEETKMLIYSRVGDNSLIKVVLEVLMKNDNRRWPNLLNYEHIENEVMSNSSSKDLNPDYLVRFLNGLSKHPDNLIVYSNQDKTYHFDWFKAKKMLKEKAIFGSVKRLLGIKAARLWNLLIKETENNSLAKLDAHQVSEKALVSPQIARSILYNLTIKGFAKVYESDSSQPVPGQTERQSVFFTSSVESSYCQTIKLGYKFASNLIERLSLEKIRNFQRNFVTNGDIEVEEKYSDPDVVEIHLINVVKYIMIMRQLGS